MKVSPCVLLSLCGLIALPGCLDSKAGAVADTSAVDAPDTADAAPVDTDAAPVDTSGVDTIDADTSPADDTVSVDVALDTATSDTAIVDTVTPDPCVGPLRISPRFGPSIGGTRVVAEGMAFYIGALTWMMKIGDAPATEMLYGEGVPTGPCQIAFDTEPYAPGTYAVYVYYGWGEPYDPSQRENGDAGTFTYGE